MTEMLVERGSLDAVASVWQPGDVVAGLYEVKGLLGEGGMGRVYRVHHRGWNLDLAVKSPRPELLARKGAAEAFETEAETWVNLGLHPHTTSCYYVRRLGEIPRVFAECVDGGSLHDWVRTGRLYEGGPEASLARILDIAIQVAWGLDHAHEQGLIHQDVKPHNILMTPDGTAKVTDFGLAKARALAGEDAGPRPGQSILVSCGGMTPAYCSPEQAERKPLSRKTDVWSWALSLLEMFSGDVTWATGFVAHKALVSYLDRASEAEHLPRMPFAVAELLRECFQSDPGARPRNMQVIVATLLDVYREVTGSSYPRPTPRPAEALADHLNNRALSLLDLHKAEEAERLWEEARRLQPYHPEATWNLGLLRARAGRSQSPLSAQLHEVCEQHGGEWLPVYLLGQAQLQEGDCEAALRTLRGIQHQAIDKPLVAAALASAEQRAARIGRLGALHDTDFARLQGPRYLSPDGRYALTIDHKGSSPTRARLCDAATEQCLYQLSIAQRYETGEEFELNLESEPQTTAVSALELEDSEEPVSHDGPSIPAKLWLRLQRGLALDSHEEDTLSPAILCRPLASETVVRVADTYLTSVEQARQAAARGEVLAAVRLLREARAQPGCRHRIEALEGWFTLYTRLPRTGLRGGWERAMLGPSTGQAIVAVGLNGDGSLGFSAGMDGAMRFWELPGGRCSQMIGEAEVRIRSAAWGADGRLAVSGSEDGSVRLWDAASGRCLRSLQGHRVPVSTVCLSPDSRRVLSRGTDGLLRLWDSETGHPLRIGRCLRERTNPPSFVAPACLSADGRLALVGNADGGVYLWDLDRGRCLRTLRVEQSHISCVSLRPDHQAFLSVDSDVLIKLRDINDGKRLQTFRGHTALVRAACFSSDGRFILSGGDDASVRVWASATGDCLLTLRGHRTAVTAVTWSADGRHVLSGDRDGALKLWLLDWELEEREPANWDEGARPYLQSFLALHTPFAGQLVTDRQPTTKELQLALTRQEHPVWTEGEFQQLLVALGCAGYGWLLPDGVRQCLETMASRADRTTEE